jgi:hypothetical protein
VAAETTTLTVATTVVVIAHRVSSATWRAIPP